MKMKRKLKIKNRYKERIKLFEAVIEIVSGLTIYTQEEHGSSKILRSFSPTYSLTQHGLLSVI